MGKNKKKSQNKSNKRSDQSESTNNANDPPGKEVQKSSPSKEPLNISSDTGENVLAEGTSDVSSPSGFTEKSDSSLQALSTMEINDESERKPNNFHGRTDNFRQGQSRWSNFQPRPREFKSSQISRRQSEYNSTRRDSSNSPKRYKQSDKWDREKSRNNWNVRDSGEGSRRENPNRRRPKEDEEFLEYQREFQKHKGKVEYEKVKEISGDLFQMPDEFSLAHCVAEDMNMGSGIAVNFRRNFREVHKLLDQKQMPGGLAVLSDKNRFIYYLVTKRWSFAKPTYTTLFSSLKCLRDHVKQNDVKKIAMPRIGCGLDRLEWDEVKYMLEFIFAEIEINIIICNLDSSTDSSTSPQKHKNCKVCNVSYPLQEVEQGTIILYFSSEDGYVSDEMKKLDDKFHFIAQFHYAKKTMGNIILFSRNENFLICGCIVRTSNRDSFDFTAFNSCLNNIKKENKKYNFEYYAFQAFRDFRDRDINYKLINLVRNSLRDVEVYVCWPGELAELLSPKDRVAFEEKKRESLGSSTKSNSGRFSNDSQHNEDWSKNDSSFGSWRNESGPDDTFEAPNPCDSEEQTEQFDQNSSQDVNTDASLQNSEDVSLNDDADHDYEIFNLDLTEGNIDCCDVKEVSVDKIQSQTRVSLVCYALDTLIFRSGIPPGYPFSNVIGHLLNAHKKPGDLVCLPNGGNFLYCVIVSKKPTPRQVFSALRKLKEHVKQYHVLKLAIPIMDDCPTDNDFSWASVKYMYQYLFGSTHADLLFSRFPMKYDLPSLLARRKNQLKHSKSPLHHMKKNKRIFIVLGSVDGYFTDIMQSLTKTFPTFQQEFVQATKFLGQLLSVYGDEYVIHACIVKNNFTDNLNFAVLENCLSKINERNVTKPKNKFTHVGMQADSNENNMKIVTVLLHCFENVEIVIHWPKEMRSFMPQ